MERINICIPLGNGSNWNNNELRFTLRSLEKHIKIPYDIFIFYDPRNKLDFIQKVYLKEVERTYPKKAQEHFQGVKHFENYFDVLHKIEMMIKDEDVNERFIMFYDDIHLNQNIYKIEDLIIPTAISHYNECTEKREQRKGKWLKTVMSAMDKLKAEGLERYDYENHIPKYFLKSKLKQIFRKYPINEQLIPYAPSTLFYNTFLDKPLVDLRKDKNYVKAGFYGRKAVNDKIPASFRSNDKKTIQEAIKDKMFINYNDLGLTKELKEFLFELFPHKSIYEN